MAATAEVVATNAAAEQGVTAATPPKAAPKLAEAAKPEPAAEEKPKAEAATPADARQSHITKFAKAMNADAEKDGVAVDAPPEERRGKPGPKPGSKRAEPKPEPAAAAEPLAPKAAPRLVISDEETDTADTAEPAAVADHDEDADTGKPEPRATHQLKAKARLRHGDVDKAIKIAFGDLSPEEFEATREALSKRLDPGSKKWAEVRRYEHAERAKSKQLETNAVQLSQRLQADFGPMIEARKAYKAGDYPKAFELAFEGEDINTFSRKAIHQKLSADPEKVRMQQRLEELERVVKAPAAQQAEPDPKQTQAAAMQREGQRTHEALTTQTDDPEIAFFAKKRAFVNRVVELRGEHYDPQSKTTISLRDAAEMARDELKRGMDEWRYDDNASGAAAPSSELPGLAGNQPVRTSAPRARSPLPSQAAQAGGSTRSMTRQERIAAFANRMT